MWYIIRHGETYHNIYDIKQGHYASLLTIKGINQIKSIAFRLSEIGEDFLKYKFITSPMVRARHTMQIIFEILGLSGAPTEDDLLAEIDMGLTVNMGKEEIIKHYPQFCEVIKDLNDKDEVKTFFSRKYPNGESYYDVFDRIIKFYEKYKNDENLVIVTHSCCAAMLQDVLKKVSKYDIVPKSMNQNYFYSWNGMEIKKL